MNSGITGMGHLYIEVRSMEQALAFWGDLGFKTLAQWEHGGHRGAKVQSGTAEAVIVEQRSGGLRPVSLLIDLKGAEAFHQRLAGSKAVHIEKPLSQTEWGTRWIHVTDPDGHTFVLEEGNANPDHAHAEGR